MKVVELIKGMFGRGGPSGPVPMTGKPEFQCWKCRATLAAAGSFCSSCGEPPPKIG